MAIIRRPMARNAAPMTDGIAREETVRETKLSPYAVGRRAAPRQRELLDAILQLDTKTPPGARPSRADGLRRLAVRRGGWRGSSRSSRSATSVPPIWTTS